MDKEREFTKWWFENWRRALDLDVESFMKAKNRPSWLRDVRKALIVSTRGMAKRMGITQYSYWRLEQAEADGRITLRNLRKCAEALDCELVYALRPKSGMNFSRSLWKHLLRRKVQSLTTIDETQRV